MVQQPLVSVCIPAYNNGEYIAETLESVLRQRYADFEIIIVDDCSTDDTVSIVRRFRDSRIRLNRNKTNLGLGRNWNKAISLANGKYLKVLCGDDVIHPDCLQRQSGQLEDPANANVVLAVCGSEVINSNNDVVLRRNPRFPAGRVSGQTLIRKCVRWGTNLVGEPAVGLFRRDVLARSGLFDPTNPYLIDLAFWAQLLKQGDAFVDQTRLAAFRISPSSVSTKTGFHQAACFRHFVQKLCTDPTWKTTTLDVTMGRALSFQWCLFRNIFIKTRGGRLPATITQSTPK
ncbi:MAG TPA: glycosyltransferase family 2 protein [Verrucomicrobiae bacterium]|nr:glycosyltransferase family 2 protein [Verrucomicrobiae bacterium]